MNKIQELEQKLNQEKNKYGLVGAKRARVHEFDDAEYNISAGINPKDWGIEINIKTGYNPIQDEEQKKYAKQKNIKDGLETMVLQVGSLHEVAHWELPLGSEKGCPFDVYNHDKIIEAVKNGLPDNKKLYTSYVANMFEDTIINPRCKEYNKDFSGQILFWDGEGLRGEKEKKGFPLLYEAFVKINMHLFGDEYDEELLKRHYTNDKKVEEVIKKIIADLNLEKNIKDTSVLFQKQNWPDMAEKYARAISELLDEIPSLRLSAYDSGQGGSGGQSQGSAEGDSDSDSEGSGGGDEKKNKSKSGNGIEQKIGTKEGKEGIAYGRYAGGDRQSPNFTSFAQLDSLYQRLAKDIPVKVEAITKENSMEISPLNYKSFDPEKDNPLKIKTSKFFFNENGFNFAYPNQRLTINYNQKIQKKSFPDFKMVMVDNSGSMKEGIDGSTGNINFIPWGDNSKYHWALLGYYGIENFLQKQGIAPYIKHGVSLFSSNTRYKTGTYNDLYDIRKLLLSPDWGSTNLDADILKKALEGEENFFLSLSDGEISNWNSERDDFQKLIQNNYYAHIQISSGKNDFTEDLESWNIPVFYVNSGKDLSKLMVDITKKAYTPFIKNTLVK